MRQGELEVKELLAECQYDLRDAIARHGIQGHTVSISDQYIMIENLKNRKDADWALRLMESTCLYKRVYVQDQGNNYRVIAEAESKTYIDSRYAEK